MMFFMILATSCNPASEQSQTLPESHYQGGNLPPGINPVISGNTQSGIPMGVHYYHKDHIGSSTLVTNETGQVVTRVNYTPYGEVVQARSLGYNSVTHKSASQELDEETDLMVYNARYYDPFVGRFITADSMAPDPNDSQAFNRYAYVQGNPIRYTDPTGHYIPKEGKGNHQRENGRERRERIERNRERKERERQKEKEEPTPRPESEDRPTPEEQLEMPESEPDDTTAPTNQTGTKQGDTPKQKPESDLNPYDKARLEYDETLDDVLGPELHNELEVGLAAATLANPVASFVNVVLKALSFSNPLSLAVTKGYAISNIIRYGTRTTDGSRQGPTSRRSRRDR
ncbi:MAG: hypothetical protein GY757_39095 [bacterium]|nr:hypothetical protein [bacterium]